MSVSLLFVGWLTLTLTMTPLQGGQEEQEGDLAGAAEPEARPEVASEVDLELLRFGIGEIAEALRVGETETARWHVEELANLLAEDEGIASEAEVALLGQLEADAESLSLPRPLFTIRERIVRALERNLPAEHPDLLDARQDLANTMAEMGDLPGARAHEEAVLEARERTLPEDHPDLLDSRNNLALTMQEMGDLPGARALQEAVLAAHERSLPTDHPDLLGARENLAITMAEMGDLPGALAHEEAVLAVRERNLPEDHPRLLRVRENLAITMKDMGDLPGARALQEAVLVARERDLPEDHPDLLAARHNLANTMGQMGDLPGARALQEAVLVARERDLPEDHPDLLDARNNLALTMQEMGDLPGARAHKEAVLAARERSLPTDHPDLLGARENLATTMFRMGDLPSARALFEAVREARERDLPEDHPYLLRARANLALTMRDMGDLPGARALQEAVLAAQERNLSEDHPRLLDARNNLALTMKEMGDLRSARALQEAVLVARERNLPEDHQDLLGSRQNLAVTILQMGDLPGARALLPPQVEGLRTRVLASLVLGPRQAREAVGAAGQRLAQVLFLSESADPALRVSAFELLETMRMVAGEAARAIRCGEGSGDPEFVALAAKAAAVRAEAGNLALSPASAERSSDELALELTRLVQERDRVERDMARRLSARGVVVRPVEVGPLAETLPTGAAAVGYRRIARWHQDEATGKVIEGKDHLLAHVLLADNEAGGTLARVDLGRARDIEELVLAWRRALGRPLLGRGVVVQGDARADGGIPAGEALRARLLDPVLAVLDGETSTLHVCADDLLYLVPLDALPDGRGGDGVLGDRYRIVNEVSFARLLASRTSEPGGPSLLLVGDVAYDAGAAPPEVFVDGNIDLRSGLAGFTPLPGTRAEVEALRLLFDEAFEAEVTLLRGNGATKESLAAGVEGKRYVHVATHGWFAPETIRSQLDERPPDRHGRSWARMGVEERVTGMAPMLLCGLALAGANRGRDSLGRMPGLLSAEELTSLDLSACDLAVLSACETNVGIRRAGQGIQSLQAALYAAGAKSSVTSLWKVDDSATRRLMELFYTALWEERKPKAEALWQAKRTLRDEGAPVRDWAGWVLTGDPD